MEDSNLKYCYQYPRPALTVDAIVIAKNAIGQKMILLIQRKSDPFKGLWALPGGFVGMEETLLQACQRELSEETGLDKVALNQFRVFDGVDRDPRHRTISIVFYGEQSEISHVAGGDDAENADWFPIDSLPELAFDHATIIGKFISDKNLI